MGCIWQVLSAPYWFLSQLSKHMIEYVANNDIIKLSLCVNTHFPTGRFTCEPLICSIYKDHGYLFILEFWMVTANLFIFTLRVKQNLACPLEFVSCDLVSTSLSDEFSSLFVLSARRPCVLVLWIDAIVLIIWIWKFKKVFFFLVDNFSIFFPKQSEGYIHRLHLLNATCLFFWYFFRHRRDFIEKLPFTSGITFANIASAPYVLVQYFYVNLTH